MGLLGKLFDRGKAKLKCRNCGHVQREGDWEDAMDRQAKGMGQAGFVNINARPECVRCGGRDLTRLP